MLIYNDPSGEAYRKLIDYMTARTATFSLKGPRIRRFPELPEDLCFWNEKRMYVMGATSHEDIATIHTVPGEVEKLYHEIPGVFIIEYSAFRDPLHILELTRHHRHDRLELMGPGAAEALDRIDELPWLRVLEVHDETLEELPKEQLALTSLPPEIGLLKRLRSLTINYTGLRELPESFAELRNLRYLDLSDNLLANENPDIVKKLPKLKSANTARDSGIYSGPHSRRYFE